MVNHQYSYYIQILTYAQLGQSLVLVWEESFKIQYQSNKYYMAKTKVNYLLIFLVLVHQMNAGAGLVACIYGCTTVCATSGPWYPVCYVGCVAACEVITACFDPNTLITTINGSLAVTSIKQGDQVLTLQNGIHKWTKVIQKIQTTGLFQFVKITTKNSDLSVTSDHVMISGDKLIKAKDLKLGMIMGNQKIEKLEIFKGNTTIKLITIDGTIEANGLLTTTICGNYIQKYGSDINVLEQWRVDHAMLLK